MLITSSNKAAVCMCVRIKVCITHSLRMSESLAEPGRSLPGSLHNPFVLVLLTRCVTLIDDDCLHCRGPQWAALHGLNLLTNKASLFAHLSITEATQDMFLLQVATLWTWLNVVLNFAEFAVISPPGAVNLYGASLLGCSHPHDAVQQSGGLLRTPVLLVELRQDGGALHGQRRSQLSV